MKSLCALPMLRLSALVALALVLAGFFAPPALALGDGQTKFKRIPVQFIAALGEPQATSGTGAQAWGLWPVDPGPRGVRLRNYELLLSSGGIAPARWTFDSEDWWVEENGLIMEKPIFPLQPGKYVVTGNREAVSVLTVHPAGDDGDQRWDLSDGATIYDVTHLRCRSARYTPAVAGEPCTPDLAPQTTFPVKPGKAMPSFAGCNKQDYAVLFVIGVAVEN